MSGGGGGSFWYGPYGFLYKKKGGAGGRRNPPYGMICGQPQYLYNKYTPGQSGVGAQSIAVRRAKNHRAVICRGAYGYSPDHSCGAFYNYLGQYDSFLYNPNGYISGLPSGSGS